MRKVMFAGLALSMLGSPVLMNTEVLAQVKSENAQMVKVLSNEMAVQVAADFAAASAYVQRGGDYQEGEYRTFTHKGQTYRYLAADIDTHKELMKYMANSLTEKAAENFIKAQGLILHIGKLAQLEADGGSLLNWEQAEAELVREEKQSAVYRLFVPVGETGERQTYIAEYQNLKSSGWRISKEPSLDLDIPFNINPAFVFFHYLLVDAEVSKDQFIDRESFPVDEFKKGITKLEVRSLNEVARNSSQVEYEARFYVELESGYEGSLTKGINQMYFLIQPTGEMEFKIESAGTARQLLKK
ncbi:DL-endopeptidase inhibitor IseA family protein [Mesobacillus campisalis]|uniref:DL-endopeptidase inhibitor IseA family protein n=1 Tax=Mesobacillus campisalis TaxID=1408103 RepID=UPI000699E18B|nr:DL-endopeptidase inhibitor IseA family protein [Mesobacillus campisalis]